MLLLRTLAISLALSCAMHVAALAGQRVAPADEYFGPLHQSILEIRNRLIGFERQSSNDLARNVRGLDNEEIAIEDWYRQYPRDPWLRGFMSRTRRLYQMAGAAGSTHAMHLGVMLEGLPR